MAKTQCPVCGKMAELGQVNRGVFRKYCSTGCQEIAQYVRLVYRWCTKNNKKFSWEIIKKISEITSQSIDNDVDF